MPDKQTPHQRWQDDLLGKPQRPDSIPEELAASYRILFSGPTGVEVLADIICELGLFGTLESPADVARHNYAVSLLTHCGVIRPDSRGRLVHREIVRMMAEMMKLANIKA